MLVAFTDAVHSWIQCWLVRFILRSMILRLFACEIRKLAYLTCERVSCVAVGAKWMSKVTRGESASGARPCSCHQLWEPARRLELVPLGCEKVSRHSPQNKILLPLEDSLQTFRRASPFYVQSALRHPIDSLTTFKKICFSSILTWKLTLRWG